MSIRSDIGFCCKTELAAEVKEKFPWVAEQSEEHVHEEGTLFHFTDIKWYRDMDEDIIALYKFLKDHDEDIRFSQHSMSM